MTIQCVDTMTLTGLLLNTGVLIELLVLRIIQWLVNGWLCIIRPIIIIVVVIRWLLFWHYSKENIIVMAMCVCINVRLYCYQPIVWKY